MHKLFKPIFWTFLFLVMMLAIDQFFVQVPPVHPAHAVVSDFYKDFRGRLVDLAFGTKKAPPKSIEAVIDKRQKKKPAPTKKTDKAGTTPETLKPETATEKPQRYLYADGSGELHFADSLDEVPDKYREQAQPLGE